MTSQELPYPAYTEPAEDYSPSSNELECDADPKPRDGTQMFAHFVHMRLGGRHGGIARNCIGGVPIINTNTGIPKPSGHYTGRAWDWMMDANKAEDRETVQKLIGWLEANDHENWRRIGLSYIIWNRKSWSNFRKTWGDYTGSSPHTDHVHFSFGVDGADGKTSFFRWLAGEQAEIPEFFRPKKVTHYGWFLVGLGIGVVTPATLAFAYHKLTGVSQTPRRAARRA